MQLAERVQKRITAAGIAAAVVGVGIVAAWLSHAGYSFSQTHGPPPHSSPSSPAGDPPVDVRRFQVSIRIPEAPKVQLSDAIGASTLLAACSTCHASRAPNFANRTPAQAGMKLRTKPVRPAWIPAVAIRVSTRSMPDAWRDYLYWTGEIQGEGAAPD